MIPDQISRSTDSGYLVAQNALARAQWEIALAAREEPDSICWPAPGVQSWAEWLGRAWNRATRSGIAVGNVLSVDQTQWLWQRVIEATPAGAQLIASAGIAQRARQARRELFDWGLEPQAQGGALWQQDRAAFLQFNRAFEEELNKRQWIDPDSLLFRLNRLPPASFAASTCLLDPGSLSPEQDRLIGHWREAGVEVDVLEPSGHQAEAHGILFADPMSEIAAAADWAADRLETGSSVSLAVVVPDLAQQLDEVEAVFGDRLGADRVYSAVGRPIDRIGIFAAAINALELLGHDSGFEHLSRWLRSPYFFADQEPLHKAAAIELQLRQDSRSQAAFRKSWHRYGLRGWLAERLPIRTAALDETFGRLPEAATPTAWTAIWQDCLRRLQWEGFATELPPGLQQAWESGWSRFAGLTPVTGRLNLSAGLAALRRIMASATTFQSARLGGLALFERIEQIGPGFGGAWITGFSDEALPRASHPNPLIPRILQLEHRMPGADPVADLAEAQAIFARARMRLPELLLSCPKLIDDRPCSPNPMFSGWRDAVGRMQRSARPMSSVAARIGARRWEAGELSAPPHTAGRIPGGVRTLDLQAACPAKAFCVARLGAEPLEPPVRGIDARMRGILVHRVLEQLLVPDGDRQAMVRFETCLDRVFRPLEQAGDEVWQAQLNAERLRIRSLIESLLAAEQDRPAFRTVAVERRAEIDIGNFRLSGRIDRIDRLEAGSDILIDYKTGNITNRWFEPRLESCQLPLYLQAQPAAAIATIRLDIGKTEYAGAGLELAALPGRYQSFDEATWREQLATWREALIALIEEFAAGDVRVRADAADHVASDDRAHAGGAFAPLTRVGELK